MADFRETRHRLPDGRTLVERVVLTPVVPDTATELLDAIDGTSTRPGPKSDLPSSAKPDDGDQDPESSPGAGGPDA